MKRSPIGMLRTVVIGLVIAGAATGAARADEEEKVDFRRQILPIFDGACADCHGVKKANGGLRLDTGARALVGGISGALVVAGKPDKSYLLDRLRGEGGEDRMPLKHPPLSAEEIKVVERWIKEGAVVPADESSD